MKTCNANYKRDLKTFTPFTFNGLTIKNRLTMPSMGTLFGNYDSTVNDRMTGYIEARAKGGVGLIFVEYTAVSPEGKAAPMELGIWDDRFISGLSRLVDVAHKHDAKIGIQLHHAGRGTTKKDTGLDVVAPSALVGTKDEPREITVEEIKALVCDYAAAAVRAQKAGFDCIEVHAGHGYLLSQFLSPFSNKRTDEYGGSLENRVRILVEIVKAIREAVGPDYPMVVRISAYDQVEGGREFTDCIEECKMLEAAGVDAIDLSVAMLDSAYMILTGAAVEPGFLADKAAELKKNINIPVFVVGKMHVPELVEDTIASGKADMVALGRAILVDPEFPNKMKDGRWENIRQCIHCLTGCYSEPVLCAQNPEVGHEYEYELRATELAKKVVVVGAGPAGLETAHILGKRGHQVVVLEKDEVCGGQMLLAATPPHKDDLYNVTEYREKEVRGSYVEIQTGVTATVDVIKSHRPDTVVIATGATPIVPPVPGHDRDNVVLFDKVLRGTVEVGQNVVVIGGGAVGSETAHLLVGQGKNVTIVEMLPAIANDVAFGNKIWLLKALESANILVNTRLLEVKDNCVVVSEDGTTKEIPCDTVVMAVGSRPNGGLADEVADALPDVELYVIGDALKVRKILHAVTEGTLVGREI